MWIKLTYATFREYKGGWLDDIHHKMSMAKIPFGYVNGDLYVEDHIIDAVKTYLSNDNFRQMMTLDQYLIKMFGYKEIK